MRRIVLIVVIVVQALPDLDTLEGITVDEQVDLGAVVPLQAPLCRLKHGPGRRTPAGEAHDARVPVALYGEPDVDLAVHLVHLAPDPGDLLLEVDVVAQILAGVRVDPQRVQRRGHHGARHLLIVEDGEAAGGHEDEKDGETARPPVADCSGIFFCVFVFVCDKC